MLVGRNVMVMVEKAINDQWIVFNFHEACLQMKELCSLDVIKISRNEVAHELVYFAIKSDCSQVFFAFFSRVSFCLLFVMMLPDY